MDESVEKTIYEILNLIENNKPNSHIFKTIFGKTSILRRNMKERFESSEEIIGILSLNLRIINLWISISEIVAVIKKDSEATQDDIYLASREMRGVYESIVYSLSNAQISREDSDILLGEYYKLEDKIEFIKKFANSSDIKKGT